MRAIATADPVKWASVSLSGTLRPAKTAGVETLGAQGTLY